MEPSVSCFSDNPVLFVDVWQDSSDVGYVHHSATTTRNSLTSKTCYKNVLKRLLFSAVKTRDNGICGNVIFQNVTRFGTPAKLLRRKGKRKDLKAKKEKRKKEHLINIFQKTLWSRVLPGKLTVTNLVKKLSAFYGTRRFNVAFASDHHLSLS